MHNTCWPVKKLIKYFKYGGTSSCLLVGDWKPLKGNFLFSPRNFIRRGLLRRLCIDVRKKGWFSRLTPINHGQTRTAGHWNPRPLEWGGAKAATGNNIFNSCPTWFPSDPEAIMSSCQCSVRSLIIYTHFKPHLDTLAASPLTQQETPCFFSLFLCIWDAVL